MGKNPLLSDVFNLIADEQRRGKDTFYKKKQTVFTWVLTKLQMMQNLSNPNAKVDRMWERLLEGSSRCPRLIKIYGWRVKSETGLGLSFLGDLEFNPSEQFSCRGVFLLSGVGAWPPPDGVG